MVTVVSRDVHGKSVTHTLVSRHVSTTVTLFSLYKYPNYIFKSIIIFCTLLMLVSIVPLDTEAQKKTQKSENNSLIYDQKKEEA